jgi:hypothetical protein
MAQTKKSNVAKTNTHATDPFELQDPGTTSVEAEPTTHIIRKGVRCGTDTRGYATPLNRSPNKIVVDATDGFIPLWAKDTTLRWRFQEPSMLNFKNPEGAKTRIEEMLGDALLKWGDAVPVKFAKRQDAWDFEIVMNRQDDCDSSGCVLASAFFPDSGQHQLILYPKMFKQTKAEQVETLIHELGHVFGLRHFFANISEKEWRSEIFGKHDPFSIMNYGDKSVLTAADKSDLKRLYEQVWSGKLTKINGTPIRLVNPFHSAGHSPNFVAADQLRAALRET